ncbi:MAG: DNA primase large subunit PriL [Pyrobaculum sp.]
MTCDLPSAELACYFPFLNRATAYLAKRGYDLEYVLGNKAVVEKALGRLRSSLAKEPFNIRWCLDEPEANAIAARLALYIATASRSQHILRRFADSESKTFTDLIRRVRGVQSPECKIEIARDLGINVKKAEEAAPGSLVLAAFHPAYAVRWTSYLRYTPQDPNWAMINRPVIRGWVILPVGDFERLMEEAYEEQILRTAKENELAVGKVASSVDLSQIEDLVKKYSYQPPSVTARIEGPDPPCMKAIIEALKSGENLPHTARFAITTYLLKRGWDVEKIVDLFRSAPDFNEKITRYQVQHIAGQAGGRKEYAVPSCETMHSWGLCPTNLGCGVKNPVQYGRRKAAATQ